jgi:hypothetical protein
MRPIVQMWTNMRINPIIVSCMPRPSLLNAKRWIGLDHQLLGLLAVWHYVS